MCPCACPGTCGWGRRRRGPSLQLGDLPGCPALLIHQPMWPWLLAPAKSEYVPPPSFLPFFYFFCLAPTQADKDASRAGGDPAPPFHFLSFVRTEELFQSQWLKFQLRRMSDHGGERSPLKTQGATQGAAQGLPAAPRPHSPPVRSPKHGHWAGFQAERARLCLYHNSK